jgi:MYXO-CTERM domain-containing protein
MGEAEDFAWIVPTPSRPEIGISTPALFQNLQWATGVSFQLQWQGGDDCFWRFAPPEADFDADDGGAGANNGGVTVVQQSSVGPYDFAVLMASNTDSLFTWLRDNNYDIPDNVMPFVEPYVLMGGDIHFVAFRLQNDRSVGDLQPVRLLYKSMKPMVPIQLTAIATQPDLGVTVNILGERRAVPENYLHVHLNEARIDWVNGGQNYNAVLTEAMNEAGGQGFHTEYAGSAAVMQGRLYLEGQYNTAALAEATDPLRFVELLMQQGFQGDAQLLNLFMRYLPMPEALAQQGVSPQDFYNCLECFSEYLAGIDFDAEGFANELEATIVEPRRHAQGLFDDLPYLTRLFTTLSAEEMDRDPVFAYNAEMGDVSNVRVAQASAECSDDTQQGTVTITLGDGRQIIRGFDFSSGGFDGAELDGEPAAIRIEQTAEMGQPLLVRDPREDVDMLDEVLDAREREGGAMGPMAPVPAGSGDSATNNFGCATAPGQAPGAGLGGLLLALGLLALRRRR